MFKQNHRKLINVRSKHIESDVYRWKDVEDATEMKIFRSQSSRIKRREKILNSTKATSKAVIGRVDPEYSGDRGKIFANHVAVKYLQSRVLCKISLVNSRMVV